MRAVVQYGYGSADVLDLVEIGKPDIGDDEVLVGVRAAGIHIGDWLVMNGLPYMIRAMGYGLRTPKNTVLGTEVAGRVEAVGTKVEQFHPGDEVFGWCTGAFAEYVAVSEDALAAMPTTSPSSRPQPYRSRDSLPSRLRATRESCKLGTRCWLWGLRVVWEP